jgi:hypothetical protein
MKHSDFHIGLEFLGPAGFRWRCTDVGTRTILAIRLDHDDPDWYRGPPYVAAEEVFDEHEMASCHLTEDDALRAAIEEADTSGHPGYPHDVVNHMMRARFETDVPYPHKGVLRFDRCARDGEILHPYAGRRQDEQWFVLLYLPFPQTFDEMPERDFIALPIATADDVRVRADRKAP